VGGNPLLVGAVVVELVLLAVLLVAPPLPHLLGGSWPPATGWLLALATAPVVLTVDTGHKAWRARHARRRLA
jgi:hypothetical protein